MSDLKRFTDPVWDRFFDFVFPCDESLTRAEVQEELRRLGIDVKRAVSKVKLALRSARAQAELRVAKARRNSLMEKLDQVITPLAENLRENLQKMISQRFKGTLQAAYFRKLEAAASQADLQSLLEDIHKLEAFEEGPARGVESWEWPAMLKELIAHFGSARVYATGLRVLGFPPTWTNLGSELLTIKDALTREGA